MKVNGNERAVPAEGTVLSLLKELGHDPQRVAVEKNGCDHPARTVCGGEADDADHLKSYASWAAADTLRTKPQFGAKGTYCVKRGYVPKKFARRERHTHFLLV